MRYLSNYFCFYFFTDLRKFPCGLVCKGSHKFTDIHPAISVPTSMSIFISNRPLPSQYFFFPSLFFQLHLRARKMAVHHRRRKSAKRSHSKMKRNKVWHLQTSPVQSPHTTDTWKWTQNARQIQEVHKLAQTSECMKIGACFTFFLTYFILSSYCKSTQFCLFSLLSFHRANIPDF